MSLHRPGGGTGATPYDVFNTDPFDPTPRQTYAPRRERYLAAMADPGNSHLEFVRLTSPGAVRRFLSGVHQL